jgi:hypothetical protein
MRSQPVIKAEMTALVKKEDVIFAEQTEGLAV